MKLKRKQCDRRAKRYPKGSDPFRTVFDSLGNMHQLHAWFGLITNKASN